MILQYLLLTIEIICSFLLIGVILLQKSKSQGAGLAFGAGVGESLFGSQVGNVLTKTTVILAIVFLANTTVLAFLGARARQTSAVDTVTVQPRPAAAPMSGGPIGGPGPGPSGVGEPVAIPDQPIEIAEPPASDVQPVVIPPSDTGAGEEKKPEGQ